MAHLSVVGETVEGLDDDPRPLRRRRDREHPRAARRPAARRGRLHARPGRAAQLRRARRVHPRPRRDLRASGSAPPASPRSTPRPLDLDADIAFLREKVDAGAEFLISQLFFDNAVYFDWLERRPRGRHRGAGHPRHPADHLPRRACTASATSARRTSPSALDEQLAALGGDEDAERAFGIAYASRQCEQLLAAGAPGIHFFVLNRADLGEGDPRRAARGPALGPGRGERRLAVGGR